MCGIVGIFSRQEPIIVEALTKATQQLSDRGPDCQSHWVASHHKVGLGHTRLSIIDLATGNQPITNEDEQLHVVVNGEFYDYEKIQHQLKNLGHRLKTRSDSEIVLHLYEEFGTECLQYLRGEFAFILWDEAKQVLFAARDRFGIKPLFYTTVGNTLYLASAAKALFAAGVPASWDYESYFQQLFIYVNQDRTLFAGVKQIPPGHYLLATHNQTQITRYWDLDYPTANQHTPQRQDNEYIELFRHKLEEAVQIRLRADVPVGSFLSGGIDSSAVLGIAAKSSCDPIRAFTVSFDRPAYDEEPIARETAKYVGADFQVIRLNQSDFAEHIADAIWHAETLGVNSHGVARYIQSRVVRQSGYKVVLSGEGSDEILAGYSHTRQDLLFNNSIQKTPTALASVEQKLGFIPSWLKEIAVKRSVFNLLLNPDYASDYSDLDVYGKFLNQFDIKGQILGREPVIQSLYLWSKSILPNYILFAERLEMANAIEVRLPFLDHHLFELVREMPVSLLVRGMKEKYVLREAARPFLTDTVYTRPKQPFTAPPVTITTNNSLYILMQDVLRSSVMASVPFFNQSAIATLLDGLATMKESQRINLEPALLMLLGTCFLQSRFNL
ncbi:asparagine synthase (glutamine-hydrolysing) [Fischerella sp. NIES-4106]|nr:asparagine synthase (glutamine-hydrolysing) [Fischerella sp. NIES-4106]